MSQVIILSDSSSISRDFGVSRYMGAYSIASSLRREGIDTRVIDYFTHIDNFFDYIENFITESTKIIGISSTFLAPRMPENPVYKTRADSSNYFYSGELFLPSGEALLDWTARLKEILRRKSPEGVLVLGGGKSQYAIWRQEYYKNFDHVCIGAGDKSFAEFSKRFLAGNPLNVTEINGTSYIDNDIDINSKMCPEALFTEQDAIQNNEALPIEVARGCIFNCKYCHFDKKESNRKDPEILRRELIRNYEKYGTTVYHLCDDCFNDHPKKVETYCEVFKNLPFKMEWVSYVRVDVAVKFPHTLDLMIESGARGLFWGLESFDEKVARLAGKGTPIEAVKKFLIDFRNKYKDQCISEGSFIVGLPGETKESIRNTADWLIENDALDVVNFGPLGMFPYVARLDKRVLDYAEFTKNPEKYGLRKVSHNPLYWEHDQMNIHEARELAGEISDKWKAFKKPGLIKSIFYYPNARTLGFTQEETLNLYRDISKVADAKAKMKSRFQGFISNYHRDLLSMAPNRQNQLEGHTL